ncbi:MAG: hypothetical protein C3F07_15615 [Anaerolineales bacterium]|nr:MAG: hypothetical protein C3F07_15615 [Anaerolineales bacterium]
MLSEEKNDSQKTTDDLDALYAHMPQNDKEQIDQVVREYEGYPAKGLAHGVQKDAIQNAFGARSTANEVKACQKDWRCIFELVSINGKEALVFWDEGTTGLTGDILSMNEIEKRSSEGTLGKEHANQRLARFLTRFESGGNLGPGSFGRGKLIFQGASNENAILVDSLRYDDSEYIAFDRKIIGTQLKQRRIMLVGEDGKKFIQDSTGGILKPLKKPGTRITILNVKDEIVESFKKSFNKETDGTEFSDAFSQMIEETWWEIIGFGAKITLKMKGKEKTISLTEPLASILTVKDKENKFRVYEKKNIPVVVGSDVYKIKHLRFVVAPEPIEEDLREIWVQRKRMKIGNISKGISLHHKIQKNFTGYIVVDSDLERLFEQKESTTHYSFNMRGGGGGAIIQVRTILRNHIEEFQKQLGLRVQSAQAKAQQDMLDTLKELNEQAQNLGLPTDFSTGSQRKDVEISIEAFTLPNSFTTRVELGDEVGPIIYGITNNTNNLQLITLEITGEQRNRPDSLLFEKDIELAPQAKENATLSFTINSKNFINREGLLIRARVVNKNSREKISQVSRMIWIGMEPPVKLTDPLTITSFSPVFPRAQTRRVELDESIKNIIFKVTNNTAIPLNVNLDLVVRKAKTPTQDVRVLQTLVSKKNYELPPLTDKVFAYEELKIDDETFGGIFAESPDARERKCEFFFSVRATKNYPKLGKNIGDHLGPKKTIPFYCGVDPAGMSIFKNLDEAEAPDDGRRSWVQGDRASGYIFVLNVEHSSYKLADDLGDEFRKYHIKEQMLFQAYLIAVEEKIFKGPAEAFEEVLSDEAIAPVDATRYVDTIVGIALNQTA